MARAGDNPQAWDKLLIALESNDVKAAQQIVIKHGFDRDQKISRYNYYCKTPDGKVVTFGTMKKLA